MRRIYSNENFPQKTVIELRRLGHDVLTTKEAGNANRRVSDEEVLSYAGNEDRIVVTHNRKHFIKLHAERRDHNGIIVCTADADFYGLAQRIDKVIKSKSQWMGELGRVERSNL